MDPIVFYDIPANVPGIAWSPHTWRIRFALNYKRLPYKTLWVEYPDIERTCKEIRAGPTTTWPDGAPMYTLPAIYDPRTGTGLADSMAIARYLDTEYPESPRVIPEGTDALHEAFQVAMNAVLLPQLSMLVVPVGRERLREASAAYYKEARERQWGGRIEEWSPSGSEIRARRWNELEVGFGKMRAWMKAGGKENSFFMGDDASFADFMVAARLMWINRVFGQDSEEWKNVERWDDGKWGKMMQALAIYSEVKT